VVRSTALLASLLPLGTRRHHRPGSHIRGPSAMVAGMAGSESSPSHHHALAHGMGAEAAIRSKTMLAAAQSWSPAHAGTGSSQPSPSCGPTPSDDSLLQKMGIASGPPPLHSGGGAGGGGGGGGGGSRRGSMKQQYSSSNSGAPVQQAISPSSLAAPTATRRSSQ